MQLYTKIILWFYGKYDFDEFQECEVCWHEHKEGNQSGVKQAVETHHIFGRSIWRTNNLLYIMAVCRDCHDNRCNEKRHLFKIHLRYLIEYLQNILDKADVHQPL